MHYANFSAWQAPYEEALSESDEFKLTDRIDAAESAIFRRLKALADLPLTYLELQAMDAYLEFQAMDIALTNLLILKREKLNFSHIRRDSLEEYMDTPNRPN
jgi:hypothetical protein